MTSNGIPMDMPLEARLNEAQAEIRALTHEVHDMRMRLSAIKVIVRRINPPCPEKLDQLLAACEGCKE